MALDAGAIKTHLDPDGQRGPRVPDIVSFSLWAGRRADGHVGAAHVRAAVAHDRPGLSGFGKLLGGKKAEKPHAEKTDEELTREEMDKIEVPTSWFVSGMVFSTAGLVVIGYFAFHIRPWLGVVAVLLAFVLSIVACRATAKPTRRRSGAMGKITQLTYGILAPSNIITNLMTAGITAGAAGSSADLLTD